MVGYHKLLWARRKYKMAPASTVQPMWCFPREISPRLGVLSSLLYGFGSSSFILKTSDFFLDHGSLLPRVGFWPLLKMSGSQPMPHNARIYGDVSRFKRAVCLIDCSAGGPLPPKSCCYACFPNEWLLGVSVCQGESGDFGDFVLLYHRGKGKL